METTTIIIILFIAIAIILHKNKKKKKCRRRPRPVHRARAVRPGPVAPIGGTPPPFRSEDGQDAFRRRGLELERLGRYQEAAEMYLKAGEIFSAAKAIASQGPEYVPHAVNLIENYAPSRAEMIVRNLVRYFFDKGELLTAAKLFHEIGLHGEAEAIEALLPKTHQPPNIQRPPTIPDSKPIPPTTSNIYDKPSIPPPPSTTPSQPEVRPDVEQILPRISREQQEKLSQPVISEKPLAEPGKAQGPRMASTDLEEVCMLCRKKIKAGEVYLKCPYCQNIFHRTHLLEWIKVKATCPVCKHELKPEIFES